eukprot:gene5214-8826_t
MSFLSKEEDILREIKYLKNAKTLWLDTEIADYLDPKKARLSLIQILPNGKKVTEKSSYEELIEQVLVFDVLDKTIPTEIFIDEIMADEKIEKVFHNKSFDLRYLGKEKAKNVKCTLIIAKSIPYHILPVENHKLGTLVEFFDVEKKVSKVEQASDWAIRPLSENQQKYAILDPVYLYIVDINLIPFKKKVDSDEQQIEDLEKKILSMEKEYKSMASEYEFLKTKLKQKMISDKKFDTENFKISISDSVSTHCSFKKLFDFVKEKEIDLDFEFYVNEKIKKELIKNNVKIEMNNTPRTVEKLLKK